jgi:hypothetical protein
MKRASYSQLALYPRTDLFTTYCGAGEQTGTNSRPVTCHVNRVLIPVRKVWGGLKIFKANQGFCRHGCTKLERHPASMRPGAEKRRGKAENPLENQKIRKIE